MNVNNVLHKLILQNVFAYMYMCVYIHNIFYISEYSSMRNISVSKDMVD